MDTTSIGIGWNIGKAIGTGGAEAVLKYDSSVYQARIDELGRIKTTLNGHLDRLKSLKEEVPTFCPDQFGESMESIVDDWIENINDRNNKIEAMQSTLRGLMEGIDDTLSKNEAELGEAKAKSRLSAANDL